MVVLENIRCRLITGNIRGKYFSPNINMHNKRKKLFIPKKEEKKICLEKISLKFKYKIQF